MSSHFGPWLSSTTSVITQSVPLKVAVVGRYSNGKSSWINAFVNKIICNTSLQRETTSIHQYKIRKNAPDTSADIFTTEMKTIHESNVQKRGNTGSTINVSLKELTTVEERDTTFSIPELSIDLDLYDFPGLNDVDDKDTKFERMIQEKINMFDLIVYVCDAKKPLTSASELNLFRRIVKLASQGNLNGNFMRIYVVVNKLDAQFDDDYKEIFDRTKKLIESDLLMKPICSIFGFSSHKYFVDCLCKTKKQIQIPNFYLNELKNILKTASVIPETALKIKLESQGILDSNLIRICAFDDWETTAGTKKTFKRNGDWDDLVGQIEKLANNITLERTIQKLEHVSLLNIRKLDDIDKIKLFVTDIQCGKYQVNLQKFFTDLIGRIPKEDHDYFPYFFRVFYFTKYLNGAIFDYVDEWQIISKADTDVIVQLFYDMLQCGHKLDLNDIAFLTKKINTFSELAFTDTECFDCDIELATNQRKGRQKCVEIPNGLQNIVNVSTRHNLKNNFIYRVLKNKLIYNNFPDYWKFLLLAILSKAQLYKLHKKKLIPYTKYKIFTYLPLESAITVFVNSNLSPNAILEEALFSTKAFQNKFPDLSDYFSPEPALELCYKS